jgi:hypothetical protein
VKTTQRYAHLAQETLLDACNSVVEILGPEFGRHGARPHRANAPAASGCGA